MDNFWPSFVKLGIDFTELSLYTLLVIIIK